MCFAVLEKLKQHKFLMLLCLAACTVYSVVFVNRATVNLSIQVEKNTVFKIYWAQGNDGFSEKRSVGVKVTPERKHYQFLLTNLHNVKKIRIDPQQYIGTSIIEDITIAQTGIKPIHVNSEAGLSQFKEVNQISKYLLEEKGLIVNSNGKDPFFAVDLILETVAFPWLTLFFRFGFLCISVTIVSITIRYLHVKLEFVPILMIVVLTLVIIMATVSRKNSHPDEYVHIEASKYYQKNWMPPTIEDPAIRHTYSRYGFSRLNKPEIFYFFSGKFAELTSFLHMKPFWLLRLFNVFLLGCILFYTIKYTGARYIAMPFLISPQIWYVFSYCNSDAFSLFITFLVGVQVATPDSTFNVFIRQQQDGRIFIRGFLLSCLLGSLLLLKQNFYPYIAFVITVLAWQIWQLDSKEERKTVLKRLLILTLIGLSLFGMRRGADYYVNGLDKADKIAKMRVETAKPLFNPQTDLNKQSFNLSMKKKGVPLMHLVQVRRFFEKTYRTMFGVYGYFTLSASKLYYDLVRWTGIALLLLFLGLIFKNSSRESGLITVSFLVFALALIGFSLLRSWTNDFQAQGRYLFPIIPMLSIVYAKNSKYLNGPLFTSIFMVMFLLSAYSFIFLAIPQIPKTLLH